MAAALHVLALRAAGVHRPTDKASVRLSGVPRSEDAKPATVCAGRFDWLGRLKYRHVSVPDMRRHGHCLGAARMTVDSHVEQLLAGAAAMSSEVLAQVALGHPQYCVGVHPPIDEWPAQTEWVPWDVAAKMLADKLQSCVSALRAAEADGRRMRETVMAVKAMVVGDAAPVWPSSPTTTAHRIKIADCIDAALADPNAAPLVPTEDGP